MSRFSEDVEKKGVLIQVSNNSPFILSESDEIWWIKKGAVDVFAILYQDDTITSRIHLCRMTENRLIFGFSNPPTHQIVKLIAIGLPDTEAVRITRSYFEEQVLNSDNADYLINGLEDWLKQLMSELLKKTVIQKNYLTLDANISLSLKPNEVVTTLKNVVWLVSVDGETKWLKQTIDSNLIQHCSFPLIPYSWLQAKTKTILEGIDTYSCMNKKILFPSLDLFYQKVIPCIIELDTLLKKSKLKLFKEIITSDARDFTKSLHQLASTLKLEKSVIPISFEKGEALLDAFELVTRAQGFKIKRPFNPSTHKNYLLEDIIKKSNLMMRQVNLNKQNWWNEDNGPLLGFMKSDNQPIVLLPLTSGGYELIDTLKNTKTRVTQENQGLIQETAVMFFRGFSNKKISIKELLLFGMHGTRKDIVRIVLMGLLAGILGVAIPYATGILFNTVIPSNEYSQLFQIILILIVITVGISIFQLANSIALLRIEGKVSVTTQAALIERLFNLPVPFFRRFTSGDLAQRAYAIENIMQIVTGTTQTAILGGIFSLFSLIYMFFISVKLALLASFLVLIALIIFIHLNYKRLQYERQYSKLQGIVLNQIFQLLNGIVKLRIAGVEIKAFVLWAKSFGENISVSIKAQNILNKVMVFNAVFLVLASLIIFGFIGLTHFSIHTGDFLAFYAAFVQFSMAMLAMSAALTSSINAIPLYERAKPILQTLPEVNDKNTDPGELRGDIEVSQLTFRYSDDTPLVVNDINFHIQPGKFIALVGPSSSGKSTVLRLLLGLEKPESGAVYYDGKDLNELNVQAVRRQIGVVIQNAKLLPGDIFTNIVGSSQATLEDAWEAARLAGFEEDIKAMPMGMHTAISEGMGTISGGQRQRLLIARAIVNKPKILLFDEASSALDNMTQAIVSKSLQQLNATRLMIAHRLSTIMQADEIYVMDQGKIVERGTFDELMKQNGRFSELAKRQIIE